MVSRSEALDSGVAAVLLAVPKYTSRVRTPSLHLCEAGIRGWEENSVVLKYVFFVTVLFSDSRFYVTERKVISIPMSDVVQEGRPLDLRGMILCILPSVADIKKNRLF